MVICYNQIYTVPITYVEHLKVIYNHKHKTFHNIINEANILVNSKWCLCFGQSVFQMLTFLYILQAHLTFVDVLSQRINNITRVRLSLTLRIVNFYMYKKNTRVYHIIMILTEELI